jgi:hypothetical protein
MVPLLAAAEVEAAKIKFRNGSEHVLINYSFQPVQRTCSTTWSHVLVTRSTCSDEYFFRLRKQLILLMVIDRDETSSSIDPVLSPLCTALPP